MTGTRRFLVWGCAIAALGGCAPHPPINSARTPATFDAARCGPPIEGMDALQGHPLVVLGEVHGMAAPPAFAVDVACRLSASGQPTHLALEIPKLEQPNIDAFLNAEPHASLPAGEFWSQTLQDGRASRARVEMLESVRALVKQGAPIRVTAFDDESVAGQQPREKAMADNILAARRAGETTIVLVGNLHARTVPGAPWDPKVVWMSVFLREAEPQLLTLDTRYTAGEAWICAGPKPEDCGVRPVRGKGQGEAWRVERYPQSDPDGYGGVFQTGKAVVSRPAKESPP